MGRLINKSLDLMPSSTTKENTADILAYHTHALSTAQTHTGDCGEMIKLTHI